MRAEENRCSNRRPTARRSSAITRGRIIIASSIVSMMAPVTPWSMICRNGTLAEGKDGCAARHRLDHHQAERLRPTLETRMATGTVKWFNPTKGYGFIEPTGAGKDMFVHISAVEQGGLSTLNEGQSIEYEIESNRGKESAVKLKVK